MGPLSLPMAAGGNKFLVIGHAAKPAQGGRRRVALTLKAARTLRMTQAPEAPGRTRAQISERTFRKDKWWQSPRITAAGLTIWVLYATVRVFTGHWYFVPQYHYLTPFYSPCVSGECVPGSSTLGQWWPAVPPVIPYAIVSLVFVLGFRMTCYYYRPGNARRPGSTPAGSSSTSSGSLARTPAGVLPGLLAFPGRVRLARPARDVHRRDQVPADRA